MKMKLSKVASALSFAHLTGVGRSAKASENDPPEDDDKKNAKGAKADGEDDDEDKDPPEDKKEGKGKASKADADTDTGDDDDDDGEEDEDDKPTSKASDDDSDEEMRGKSPAAAARRRERARCAAIFASPAAGRNPALAASLAFNTTMTRAEAITVLESTPGTGANAQAASQARADRNPRIGGGGARSSTTEQAVSTGWDRAFAKATGKSTAASR